MKNRIEIGRKAIGEDAPCFIVAELGVNHNQDLNLAKRLIDAAAHSGADAVKFQTWKTEKIILKNVKLAEYQKNTKELSQYDLLKRLELPYEWHHELKERAENKGLSFFSTMEDKESVDFLDKLGVPLFKVGSGDLTNYPLLKYTARKKKPMILSTGMATLSEVDEAVRTVLEEGNEEIVLLHCTSSYPCPIEDVNLKAMISLRESFKTIIGYSDHTLGFDVPLAAVSLGAKYIEKHFTLNKNLPGPDHKLSLEPEEFRAMVRAIRNIEKTLGDGIKRPMPSEMKNKEVVRRKMVAARDVKKGEVLGEENIIFKRANYGLDTKYFKLIEGKVAKKDIKKDEVISFSLVEE